MGAREGGSAGRIAKPVHPPIPLALGWRVPISVHSQRAGLRAFVSSAKSLLLHTGMLDTCKGTVILKYYQPASHQL